jgi:hypothetical protein
MKKKSSLLKALFTGEKKNEIAMITIRARK